MPKWSQSSNLFLADLASEYCRKVCDTDSIAEAAGLEDCTRFLLFETLGVHMLAASVTSDVLPSVLIGVSALSSSASDCNYMTINIIYFLQKHQYRTEYETETFLATCKVKVISKGITQMKSILLHIYCV